MGRIRNCMKPRPENWKRVAGREPPRPRRECRMSRRERSCREETRVWEGRGRIRDQRRKDMVL